jgi:hypothetical protein
MFSDEKTLKISPEKLDRVVRPYLRKIILDAYRAGAPIENLTEVLQGLAGDDFEKKLVQMPEYLEDITTLFKDDIIVKFFQVTEPTLEDLAQLKTILRQEIASISKELNVLVQEDLIPKNTEGVSDDQIRIKLMTERRKIFPASADSYTFNPDDYSIISIPEQDAVDTILGAMLSGTRNFSKDSWRDLKEHGCTVAMRNKAFMDSMKVFQQNFFEGDGRQFHELKQNFPKSFDYFLELFNVGWDYQLEKPKKMIETLSHLGGIQWLQNLENALLNPLLRPLIKPFDRGSSEVIVDPRLEKFSEAFNVYEVIQLGPNQRGNLIVCLEEPKLMEYLQSAGVQDPKEALMNCSRLEVNHLEFIKKLLDTPELQESIRKLTEEDKLDLTSLRLSTQEMSILVEALKNEQLINSWLKCNYSCKFLSLLFAEKPGNLANFKEKLALDVNLDLLNQLSADEWRTLFYDLPAERSREVINFLFPTENEYGKQPGDIQMYFREMSVPTVLLVKDLSVAEMEKLKNIFAQNGFEGNNMWNGYENFKHIRDNFLKTGKFYFKDMLDNFSEEEWASIVFSRNESREELSVEALKTLDDRCQIVAERSIQRQIQQERLKLAQAELDAVKPKAEVMSELSESSASDFSGKPDLQFLREARLKALESQRTSPLGRPANLLLKPEGQ